MLWNMCSTILGLFLGKENPSHSSPYIVRAVSIDRVRQINFGQCVILVCADYHKNILLFALSYLSTQILARLERIASHSDYDCHMDQAKRSSPR